jgi:hypothetical protein
LIVMQINLSINLSGVICRYFILVIAKKSMKAITSGFRHHTPGV